MRAISRFAFYASAVGTEETHDPALLFDDPQVSVHVEHGKTQGRE